ncbi:MAG TPA: protein kinase [Candidatus Competibacter sp.]|nr:protein kinase [Candidatus Competibacter sp.]
MSFNGSSQKLFHEHGPRGESLHPSTWVQIPGYEIECEIGRGGMATVYRAMQQSLGRQVAIKILAHGSDDDSEFARRFRKEGRILAQLLHLNIVTIHDIGASGHNQLYLSVEYLPGGTLKDRIRQGLSLGSAIEIIQAIAKALGYAHERGVIHRDVKPSNIMFRQDGTPVLTDFGVARIIDSKTVFTASGFMIGSPGYMSPEQAMGESATVQSDLYGLGVVLYEMLTGCALYRADNPLTLMLKHLHDPIPELPKTYAHFQPILNKLLAKNIEDRYKNSGEFLEELSSIVPGDTESRPEWNTGDRDLGVAELASGEIRRLLRKRSRFFLVLIGAITIISVASVYTLKAKKSIEMEIAEILPKSVSPITKTAPEQREIEILRLLKKAEMKFKDGLLTDESRQNAELIYRQILRLDQGNIEALNGLENIAKQYEQSARQYLENGALQESLDQIEKGLSVVPEHSELVKLRQEVQQDISEEERRQLAKLQADQFFMQAQKSSEEGLSEISLALIEQGLLAAPNHSGLLALREQLKSQIAEQNRQIEIRKQQGIEQQRQAEKARQHQKVDQYFARALSYQKNSDYSASLQQIEKGLAIIPNHKELLRLQRKVHAQWSADKKRQNDLHQPSKQAKRQTTKSKVMAPKGENDETLKKIQDIKNTIDALDKSLGR